jgi:hypothetical protein
MKNALWFLYKPVDEREQGLYGKAFTRCFSFLMSILLIGMFILRLAPYGRPEYLAWRGFLTAPSLALYFLIIIVSTYFIGRSALKNEELESQHSIASHPFSWGVIIVLLTSIFIVDGLEIYFGFGMPHSHLSLLFVIPYWILLGYFAWRSSDKLQYPIRLILAIFAPSFTLILSRISGKTLGSKVIKTIGLMAIPFIILLGLTIGFLARTLTSSSLINANIGFHIGGHYFPIASSTRLDLSKPLFSTSTQDGITTYHDLLYRFQFSYLSTIPDNYIMSGGKVPSNIILTLSDTAQVTIFAAPKIDEESPRNIERKGFKKVMINTVQAWQKIEGSSDKEVITTTLYGEDSQFYFTYENLAQGDQKSIDVYTKILGSFKVLN